MQDEDPQELIKKLEKLVGGHVELEKLIRQTAREEIHKVVKSESIVLEHREEREDKAERGLCQKCGKPKVHSMSDGLWNETEDGKKHFCQCNRSNPRKIIKNEEGRNICSKCGKPVPEHWIEYMERSMGNWCECKTKKRTT